MDIKAAIFDLDGTVVADEDEYGQAFNRVLEQFGIDTGSPYPHIAGIGVEENWVKFKNKYKSKIDKSVEELSVETQQEYIKLLNRIHPKKGFVDFVKSLKNGGVKIALATSNSWVIVDKVLKKLKIEHYFDCMTTAEEVEYKKPDTQIFEITLDKLGVTPKECVVFEDSAAGVKAAKNLGIKVIAFYRSEGHKRRLRSADRVVKDFSQITISEL